MKLDVEKITIVRNKLNNRCPGCLRDFSKRTDEDVHVWFQWSHIHSSKCHKRSLNDETFLACTDCNSKQHTRCGIYEAGQFIPSDCAKDAKNQASLNIEKTWPPIYPDDSVENGFLYGPPGDQVRLSESETRILGYCKRVGVSFEDALNTIMARKFKMTLDKDLNTRIKQGMQTIAEGDFRARSLYRFSFFFMERDKLDGQADEVSLSA